MKNFKPSLMLMLIFFSSCNKTAQPNFPNTPIKNIDVVEFKAKMQNEGVIILDVRTPLETALGKIEGAKKINVKAKDFKDKVQLLEKDKTYLVYCRSGRRSTNASKIMTELGFENVYNLKGGYLKWSNENK